MKSTTRRAGAVTAALAAAALVMTGCSDDGNDNASASSAATNQSASAGAESGTEMSPSNSSGKASAELTAADGTKVTLTGSIAEKYNAATEAQKKDLGAPMTGDKASGKSENGVVFQQFDGGVITAKNGDAGTPAYITWGKIRDAWNVPRADDGKPAKDGKGGSMGPLGIATSDEMDVNGVKESTFENGKITWDSKTDKVVVTVKGEVVPTQ